MAIIGMGEKPWGLYGVRYVQRKNHKEFGEIAPQAVFSLNAYRRDTDLFLSHFAVRVLDIRRRFEVLSSEGRNLFSANRPMTGSWQALELLSGGQFLVSPLDEPFLKEAPFDGLIDHYEKAVFGKKNFLLVSLKFAPDFSP